MQWTTDFCCHMWNSESWGFFLETKQQTKPTKTYWFYFFWVEPLNMGSDRPATCLARAIENIMFHEVPLGGMVIGLCLHLLFEGLNEHLDWTLFAMVIYRSLIFFSATCVMYSWTVFLMNRAVNNGCHLITCECFLIICLNFVFWAHICTRRASNARVC